MTSVAIEVEKMFKDFGVDLGTTGSAPGCATGLRPLVTSVIGSGLTLPSVTPAAVTCPVGRPPAFDQIILLVAGGTHVLTTCP